MNAALARRAGKLLKEAKARRLTLATAESCTAGTLALRPWASRRRSSMRTRP
jgi:nicotinamide mononucleotide (NMN) deamidase PncC